MASKSIRLVALKPAYYCGEDIHAGQEFDFHGAEAEKPKWAKFPSEDTPVQEMPKLGDVKPKATQAAVERKAKAQAEQHGGKG